MCGAVCVDPCSSGDSTTGMETRGHKGKSWAVGTGRRFSSCVGFTVTFALDYPK